MVDVQQLLRVRIAPERGPVGHHPGREIRADAGQRLEGGAVGLVQVDAGDVDVRLQAVEDGIGYYIRLCKVRGPAEAAALGSEALEGGGLTALELACDNAVNRYIASAKLIPFGEEPVVAYLAAVESEITAVRMILTGRLAGIASDTIRERLRDFYA